MSSEICEARGQILRSLEALYENYDVSFNNLRVVDAPGSFDTDYDADGGDCLQWQRGLTLHALSSTDLAEWRTAYGAATRGLRLFCTSWL